MPTSHTTTAAGNTGSGAEHPWTRRALRTTAAFSIAVLTLTNCASSQPAPSDPVPTPTVTNGVEGLHLPIEIYMLTPKQATEYDWVRQAATGACMKRYGQDYPVVPQPTSDSQMYGLLNRRYGVADTQTARAWGYHNPTTGHASDGSPDSAPVTIGQMKDTTRTVLTGADPKTGARAPEFAGKALPEHGCGAELERLMPAAAGGPGGPASGGEGLVTAIKAQTFTESQTDPKVVTAVAAWSSCMKSRGYNLTDPLHATDNVTSLDDPAPGTAEIAQALTDVACKHETNLIGIWFAAESDRQNTLINAHAEDFAKAKTALTVEVAQLDKLRNHDWTQEAQPAS
ncbi:hypothetical protein ACIQOV_20075 [Kitasatospora sp. NPDC091257]|uniref:hypothetical protein n=1 Tax=unclassified Kitasatospora TaxID=2633591 RepID=UPI002F9134F8